MWWMLLLNFLLLLQYIHVSNQDFTPSTPTRTYTHTANARTHTYARLLPEYLFTVQAQNVSCFMLFIFLLLFLPIFTIGHRIQKKAQAKRKSSSPARFARGRVCWGLYEPILSPFDACLLASVDSLIIRSLVRGCPVNGGVVLLMSALTITRTEFCLYAIIIHSFRSA